MVLKQPNHIVLTGFDQIMNGNRRIKLENNEIQYNPYEIRKTRQGWSCPTCKTPRKYNKGQYFSL